jgi:transposase-like protein
MSQKPVASQTAEQHVREIRRRWTASEKLSLVQATYEPGVTVSLVARRNGISPLLFRLILG